ncbi:MAG: diguanylate cyclase [Pirellulales bacterium]
MANLESQLAAGGSDLAIARGIVTPAVPAFDGPAVIVPSRPQSEPLGDGELVRSLLETLGQKHLETVVHSARVTLGASAWSSELRLNDQQRRTLETAALLHDIGKVIVPREVLLKPAALTSGEAELMRRCLRAGAEMIAGNLAARETVEVVRSTHHWYDGTNGSGRSGDAIPFVARALAIIDAFDAMTSPQRYRAALSTDEAIAELRRLAGRKLDPELVQRFADYVTHYPVGLHDAARQWVQHLVLTQGGATPATGSQSPSGASAAQMQHYQQHVFQNSHSGIAFVDGDLNVISWNPAAEQLTGLTAAQMRQLGWRPSVLGMRDMRGFVIRDDSCPVRFTVQTGQPWNRRVVANAPDGQPAVLDLHTFVVRNEAGVAIGAAILMDDATPQMSMELKYRDLNTQIRRDPLTDVANRAHFDEKLAQLVQETRQGATETSLILCDVDHFKSINDTYGHQVGDDVLVWFAGLLQGACRRRDLVARYGGEEFALLFTECDAQHAYQRAEEIRVSLCETEQKALDGRPVTVSFGVTVIKPTDSPEDVVRRADAALYCAKRRGRNMVVYVDNVTEVDAKPRVEDVVAPQAGAIESELVTSVPSSILMAKIEGFIEAQQGKISYVDPKQIRLVLGTGWLPRFFRGGGNEPLACDITMQERPAPSDGPPSRGAALETVVRLTIRPQRRGSMTDRRLRHRAGEVLRSFRAHMMESDEAARLATGDA